MKELQITKEQKIKLVRLIIDKMSIAELKDLFIIGKDIKIFPFFFEKYNLIKIMITLLIHKIRI